MFSRWNRRAWEAWGWYSVRVLGDCGFIWKVRFHAIIFYVSFDNDGVICFFLPINPWFIDIYLIGGAIFQRVDFPSEAGNTKLVWVDFSCGYN